MLRCRMGTGPEIVPAGFLCIIWRGVECILHKWEPPGGWGDCVQYPYTPLIMAGERRRV
jgi:hypothetical protein